MSTKENQLRKYIECKEKHKQKMKTQFPQLYQEYQKMSDKKVVIFAHRWFLIKT